MEKSKKSIRIDAETVKEIEVVKVPDLDPLTVTNRPPPGGFNRVQGALQRVEK
jgi:hypothetical protein